MKKFFIASLLSLSVFISTSYATPAWQMPDTGKIFSDDATKKAYISDYMAKLYSGKITLDFSAPDGWSHEKFLLGGVKVESRRSCFHNRKMVTYAYEKRILTQKKLSDRFN